MLMRSHSERRALLGFSALLTQAPPKPEEEEPRSAAPRDSLYAPVPLATPPPWVTQALSNLEQGELELRSLRERQQGEVDEVCRELDDAALEAQREERRLLERIERDHRDAQQRMSQVRRENAAAARVVQSLVDHHLRKIGQLREQILRWGSTAGGANKNQLQRGVAEVTQPWEISLTLKRVRFLPRFESEPLLFGEVDVHEQGMTYPIGVCGVQGQKCALHSGDAAFANKAPLEIRKEPASSKIGQRNSSEESVKSNGGSARVVRKLRLSSSTENEEELQDEEADSACPDLFLAVAPPSSQSEGDESDGSEKTRAKGRKKKQKALVALSRREPSRPPEDSLAGLPRKKSASGSPADGEDRCDAANTPVDGSPRQGRGRSASSADLSGEASVPEDESRGTRRVNRMRLASEPSSPDQSQGRAEELPPTPGLSRASRSLSMSAIEGDQLHRQLSRDRKERAEPALRELDEEGGATALDAARLVKQLGKQGSGRADFNLPSGVHATPRGQLFVVDCGNARVQVTDLQKNVVQQVAPSGSERSSRVCNYFDVAVNSKGLIALTCAAERAVLVFSRHGRLLQTFGGVGAHGEELDAPRGVAVDRHDDFLVADIKRGTLTALKLDAKTGARLERTVVTGYHRPYLVAACLTTGLMAVSERGSETGRVPCIRVLEPGWNTVRILGVCSGLGPVLTCPWGLCIDSDGDVLVADWGKRHHRVLVYPSRSAKSVGWPLVADGLSSPRGLALLPDGHVVVSDSMNHCLKIYRYK